MPSRDSNAAGAGAGAVRVVRLDAQAVARHHPALLEFLARASPALNNLPISSLKTISDQPSISDMHVAVALGATTETPQLTAGGLCSRVRCVSNGGAPCATLLSAAGSHTHVSCT